MNLRPRYLGKLLLLAAFAIPIFGAGCAAHVRYYDPYYNDYHGWDNRERGYYNQWIVETHRPHTDYGKLSPDDQKQYWQWRHTNHPDNDRH